MKQRGFTLIELLFTIAIIAILAAIAVPNFLEAQVRSKLAATRGDLATTAAALEHYYVDYTAYPPNMVDFSRVIYTTQLTSATVDLSLLDIDLPGNEIVQDEFIRKEEERFERLYKSKLIYPNPANLKKEGIQPNIFMQQFAPDQRDNEKRWLNAQFDVISALNGLSLKRLTTPLPYLRPMRKDYFYSRESYFNHLTDPLPEILPAMRPFRYANLTELYEDGVYIKGRNVLYLLLSISADTEINALSFEQPTFLEYDPTNGTISPGDTILYGPVN